MNFDNFWNFLSDDVSQYLPYHSEVCPLHNVMQFFEDWPGLGWINWLFPVGDAVLLLGYWATGMVALYLGSVVLRWCKILAD